MAWRRGKAIKLGMVLIVFVLLMGCCLVAVEGQQQCGMFFTKLTACLRFATGKGNEPSEECCSSVRDINNGGTDLVCLCLIIQQIHHGNYPQLKIMGVQEAPLLRLPAACNFTNAALSHCPRLLQLPPNSTDAAIFNQTYHQTASSPATPPAEAPLLATFNSSN